MLRVLVIGGTGTISRYVVKLLEVQKDIELVVVNRGNHPSVGQYESWIVDANNMFDFSRQLEDQYFDSVIDFVVYTPEQAKNRVELFQYRTKQYIFISTVVSLNQSSTYLTVQSPFGNMESMYGQSKALAEQVFQEASQSGFPLTVIRPSQTYSDDRFPFSVKGRGCYSVMSRILNDKPVLIHGDGTSLWHMMHAEDFARQLYALIGNPFSMGKTIFLVNPKMVSWNEIYDEIGRQLKRKIQKVYLSTHSLSKTKEFQFKESIGGDKQYSHIYEQNTSEWLPKVSVQVDLKEGVTRYLNYLMTHSESQVEEEKFDEWCDRLIEKIESFEKELEEQF